MKRFLLLACLFVFACQLNANAQAPLRVNVDLKTNTLTINDVLFTLGSTIEDYEKLLGRANRIEQKRGVDQYFIYDKLGIALSLEKDTDSDVVSEVFITYLNDGDGRVAQGVYEGKLSVNNQEIKPQITHKEMSKLVKLDFVEVMNGYFISPKKEVSLLLYYPEKAPYTMLKQFAVRFGAVSQ